MTTDPNSNSDIDPEDAKLITLARGARERIQAPTGVAVRDDLGRTYAAADALMPSGGLAAVPLVLAQAWISGARALEAVALVSSDPSVDVPLGPIADMTTEATMVLRCSADGSIVELVNARDLRARADTP